MPHNASVAELKARARNLRTYIEATSHKPKYSECLEHVAHTEGFKDWNACVASRPRFRPGMTNDDGIDIEETSVPKCNFAYNSTEYIKSRIGAEDLKLVYSANNDLWWDDFIYLFWFEDDNPNDNVSQGDEGFDIRKFSARGEAGTLWVELNRDGRRFIALRYPESNGFVSDSLPREMPNDPTRELKSKSPVAKDRAWANRPVTPEIRVFSDSIDTFEIVKRSHFALLTTRLKYWNNQSMQTESHQDGRYIFENAMPGSIWKCHQTWDLHKFVFCDLGETIEILEANKSDNTLKYRHLPSGKIAEMTAQELMVGFWCVDQDGEDVTKTFWKIYRKNGLPLSDEPNKETAYDY